MATQIIPANLDTSSMDDISDDCTQMISALDIVSEANPMFSNISEEFPVESGVTTLHSIFMFLQDQNEDPTTSKDTSHTGINSSIKRVPPGLLSPARMTPLRSVRPARLL
jgi:hypothetical protein